MLLLFFCRAQIFCGNSQDLKKGLNIFPEKMSILKSINVYRKVRKMLSFTIPKRKSGGWKATFQRINAPRKPCCIIVQILQFLNLTLLYKMKYFGTTCSKLENSSTHILDKEYKSILPRFQNPRFSLFQGLRVKVY